MYRDIVELAIREFTINSRFHEEPAILVMRYDTYYALVAELDSKFMAALLGPDYMLAPQYKNQKIIRTINDVEVDEVKAY